MKCNFCGSEWKIVGTHSQVKSCPFCGKELIVPFTDETSLDSSIRTIFDHFGYELLRDNKKFLSVFSDIAPKMKSERKMIEVALEQGVADLFVGTPAPERESAVRQAIRKLEIIMSENAIYTVVSSLIIAMDWDTKLLELLPSNSPLEKNMDSKCICNTVSTEITTPSISQIDPITTELISNNAELHTGDLFELGKYNNESLHWVIIQIKGEIVVAMCYDSINSKKIGSSEWLNDHFYKYSFTTSEKQCISNSILPAQYVIETCSLNKYDDDSLCASLERDLHSGKVHMWCWDPSEDCQIDVITINEHFRYNNPDNHDLLAPHCTVIANFRKPLLFKHMQSVTRRFDPLVSEMILNYSIGSIVTFGNYKSSPIRWLVIDRSEVMLTLLSCECVEYMPFHLDRSTNRFERSSLNSWLTKDFIPQSFNSQQRPFILDISLLDKYEVDTLFKDTESLKNGSWWWLSTPIRTTRVERVNGDGSLSKDGNCVDDPNGGVRPVIRLRLIPQ